MIDRKYDEMDGNLWTVNIPLDDDTFKDDPYFYIELPYGEVHPRLAIEKQTKK